ncbi:MAG: DUF881 domain-containing protein, partial [Dehalococcoidia bacterium]|nr:DUF881 domain-containing protein [Dehalococcoidia bacterium]
DPMAALHGELPKMRSHGEALGRRSFLAAHAFPLSRKRWAFLIIPVMFGLGMLLSSARYGSDGEKPAAQDPQAGGIYGAAVKRLEKEQKLLRVNIARLRKEAQSYQQMAGLRKDAVGDLADELRLQMMVAGVIPLKGPGVRIVLDDSMRQAAPGDPNLYIIHDYQLRDTVNLLWQAGAESIAINTERLVANTSIYSSGGTIMVNTTRLSPPFVVLALGDPDAMMDLMSQPSSLRTLKAQARAYGLVVNPSIMKEVQAPAFSGSYVAKYLNVEEPLK